MRPGIRVASVTHEHARILTPTGFDQDDGSADPGLIRVLADCHAGTVNRHAVYPVLAGRRVLAPVVAVLGESAEAGTNASGVRLRRDKDSDMALVTLVAGDGTKAVPVFTSTDRLTAWGAATGLPDARPVPIAVEHAAAAALQEGAQVLVLDPGTDGQFSLGGAALRTFAAGRTPLPPDADPDVLEALRAVLRAVPEIAGVLDAARIGPDAGDGAVLELGLAPGADRQALQVPLGRLAELLGADPLLRERLGDQLAIVVGGPAAA
jgi:hypothetical protein